ncbi:hypothetical protein AcW1_004381 [Taiwanofungus camphoratus]|nr:hypothetical protein AcW1_004381 [Antrodia cinnamomea]
MRSSGPTGSNGQPALLKRTKMTHRDSADDKQMGYFALEVRASSIHCLHIKHEQLL